MDKIRIVLADDHPAYRNSLQLMLEREADLSVVAIAEDGPLAIQTVEEHKPDVVLTDFRLPKMSGVEATRVITSRHPNIKVIMLTLFMDDCATIKALEAGAYNCLSKDCHFQGILAVIRNCHNPRPPNLTGSSPDSADVCS